MDKPFFIEALEKGDPDLLARMTSLQDFVGKEGRLRPRSRP